MRSNDTETTYYLYDREDRIADYDQSDNLITAYTHGPGIDEPVAMTTNGNTYFYIPDIQGSIRAIVDINGNAVATYQYDVWGNLISYNGTLAEKNDYLYTGREYDWQTGIYYYRARYYNPEIGRFLQSSWEHTKEMNMYVYVGNDPATETDPTGHPYVGAPWAGPPGEVSGTDYFRSYVINTCSNSCQCSTNWLQILLLGATNCWSSECFTDCLRDYFIFHLFGGGGHFYVIAPGMVGGILMMGINSGKGWGIQPSPLPVYPPGDWRNRMMIW